MFESTYNYGQELEFHTIPNCNGYTISNKGVVYSKNNREIKQDINKHGLCRVELTTENNKRKKYNVGELVATLFIRPKKDKEVLIHIDGNRTNNSVENLKWGTQLEKEAAKYQYNGNNLSSDFKELRDYPGFYCNPNGIIIGRKGKPMIGSINRCGYRQVLLSCDQKSINKEVHRIVLETFNPIPNMNMLQVNHINGIKTDNNINNLEWCTRSENLLHAYKIGLEQKSTGLKNHTHVLNKEILEDIRTNCVPRCKGKSFSDFAKKYNINISTVSRAYNRRTYNED